MNEITINTVQGIGDIFWCYQKLSPHFDRINVNVLCLSQSAVQHRARPFLRMLPKVGAVQYVEVPGPRYKAVASMWPNLADVLREGGTVDYAVNHPLEQGVNLREIDPGAAVADFVDLGLAPTVERGGYLCVFVAGSRNSQNWTPAQWVVAIRRLCARLGTDHVKLIGAGWDVLIQAEVERGLAGLRVENHVDRLTLADSLEMIRGARLFFGFQSGLHVIADNYGVPQLMVYYEMLARMLWTWCKPEHVGTVYQAATFKSSPEAVADGWFPPPA